MPMVRDMPIKRRVFFVVMITTLAALAVGSSITLFITYESKKGDLQRDLSALAKVIGDNCKVSIAYNIPEDSIELLAALRKRPSIVHAIIHDEEENDFAAYYRGTQTAALPRHHQKTGEYANSGVCADGIYMRVWEPILFEGEQIGCLHIFDDMSGIREIMRKNLFILGVFSCFVLVVAYLMTLGLDSLVSTPVSYLSSITRKVSSTGDFGLRAERMTGGEIGELADSFNDMLEHIECSSRTLESLVKELESKNSELERFAYTVSHDLKSPLITIQGFTGQLKKHCDASDKPKVKRDIERIEEAAKKMNKLLEDLLELSRVGYVIGDVKPVEMNEIVAGVLSMLDAAIKDSSVEIVVHKMPQVEVDPTRFTEVMQNLIDNAIKFLGDQSEPKVTIGCRKDNDTDVFFVEDNGLGVEDDYREKVFGLFEQLNQHIPGTGIGLTIVRRIIELHGGTIWIEDGKDGVGTRFCFTVGKAFTDTGRKDAR